LLVRWPGSFRVIRPTVFRSAFMMLRVFVALWGIHAIVTWEPITTYPTFLFENATPTLLFRLASPAMWLGVDPARWMRLEWYLFNAGLWMALAGVAILLWWLAWSIAPLVGWPRYYVAFLSSRLLQRKRIAFFSVGAVTLCVAMMIIV